MPRFVVSRVMVMLIGSALCVQPLLFAGAPSDQQVFVVTVRPEASVDGLPVIARQMAASYGGTVVAGPGGGEDAFVLRMPQSRARVIAVDPRVKSVVPMHLAPAPQAVIETVSWSSGVAYSYDGSGNISQIGSDVFRYDGVSRLVQANVNSVNRTYQYDAYGNRTACTQVGPNDCQGFSINSAENKNRVTQAGYDLAGNLTNLSGHVYSYDATNMMTRDTFGQLAREFVYTAEDERIATYAVGSSSWSWTIRGTDGKVLREFMSYDGPAGPGTTGWQWSKDHVWRNGQLLASRQPDGTNTTTYHYHLDHLGTPRRVTDQNDRIVGVHDYFAFGPELSGGTAEPSATTLKYTSHERDNWSSGAPDTLDYMHARYYNPTVGRFLSVDPIVPTAVVREPQRWNRYAYVSNNPMKNADPTGKLLEVVAGTCDDTTPCYSKVDAYQAVLNFVGKDAAKYLQLGKNGQVTLNGISAANFIKLGGGAAIIGNLIRSTDRTAAFALSADAKGGAFTEQMAGGTLTKINPAAFPTIMGGATQTLDTAMAHDLGGHALMDMWGISPFNTAFGSIDQRIAMGSVPAGEAFAVTRENEYRATQGMDIREFYFFKYDYNAPPGAPKP